ncbi:MAG TPA: ABC transporter ATP-binding protein [Nitrospiraceae bacterium]|nr:ABC transporter ATP-binding protein [Nitrospiraceae bacterium]
MSSDIAIRVHSLRKEYRLYNSQIDRVKQWTLPILQKCLGRRPADYCQRFVALADISFEVRKGETLGVIGPNGSGKSTLLQLICGTLTPTSGTLEIDGRVAALLELGAGFHPEFTGRENVYLNGALLGLSTEEIDKRFDAIAAFADVGRHIDQPVKTYSSGMYVRLAFSVVTHVNADILIIDEALAVGDIQFQQQCMKFLADFQKQGKTLLIVSHDLNAIKALCRTAIHIEHGVIVDNGMAGTVVDRYVLQATRMQESVNGADVRPKQDTYTDHPSPTTRTSQQSGMFLSAKEFERSGSGQVRIASVELQSACGEAISRAHFGQVINLVVRLDVVAVCRGLIVAFYVKDRRRLEVIGTNSENEGQPLYDVSGGQSYVFQFGFAARLKPGLYSVSVLLANSSQATEFYDWMEDVVSFEVLPTSRAIYALYSPPIELAISHQLSLA